MALMRAFSKVDKEGKIPIPSNIRRQANLKEGEVVEIKVAGTANSQHIVINRRARGKTR